MPSSLKIFRRVELPLKLGYNKKARIICPIHAAGRVILALFFGYILTLLKYIIMNKASKFILDAFKC
jgi:hypothetical protein